MNSNVPLPLFVVPGLRAARLRGRPKKLARAPAADARLYHQVLAERRAEALADDPLVHAADQHGNGDVLDQVIVEIAREAAGLRFGRERAQERGLESTAQMSSRVIDAYGKLSALVLQRHELRRGEPDQRQIQSVGEMFVSTVSEVAIEVLTTDVAATLIDRLREALCTTGRSTTTPQGTGK